jgi:uncharacterized membrane protein
MYLNELLLLGVSITISMLVPFPISLVVIVGTFLLLNFYLRRRMMARMGSLNTELYESQLPAT